VVRVLFGLLFVIVAACSTAPPAELVVPAPAAPTSTTVESLVVHVAGWVRRPGLVEVAAGARVADVVAAAGGVLPGGDLAALNLAAPVRDGDQVRVPGPDESKVAGSVGSEGLVDVNRAGVAELERLPGVGPVLAERIVAHRERYGPFETVEDLLDVPGIGEAKLAALRDAIALP